MKLTAEQKAYLKSIDSKKKRKKQKELFKIKNNSSTNSTLTEHLLKTIDIDKFHNPDNYNFDEIVIKYVKNKKK
jgi:hypothetical protein